MAAQQRPNLAQLPRLNLDTARSSAGQAAVATGAAGFADVLPSPSLWMRTPQVPKPPVTPLARSDVVRASESAQLQQQQPHHNGAALGGPQHAATGEMNPSTEMPFKVPIPPAGKYAASNASNDAHQKAKRSGDGAVAPAPLPTVAPRIQANQVLPNQSMAYAHLAVAPAVVSAPGSQGEELGNNASSSNERKALRAIRNREAAMKSRRKEKSRLALMETENERMVKEIERLNALNERLRDALITKTS
mmetsp:Transcript_12392/g.27060  ORF Transcript_12392/g.27060 Transcript_12392/m.27060 type:complete len:248 (+) Transcript_12392:95-838(+)